MYFQFLLILIIFFPYYRIVCHCTQVHLFVTLTSVGLAASGNTGWHKNLIVTIGRHIQDES